MFYPIHLEVSSIIIEGFLIKRMTIKLIVVNLPVEVEIRAQPSRVEHNGEKIEQNQSP